MVLVSSDRIRSIIADCRTEADLVSVLRSHKIRYSFATDTGYLSIRIPCRKGYIRVYKACSRSASFIIRSDNPVPVYPVPVLHPEY